MPAGYGKSDGQRAKAMKMIEPGVMKVASGKMGAPVRGNPTAVSVQRNNARMDVVNPPPPAFKRGGKVVKEGSPADMKADRKGAKKAGMTMKQYEGSPMDMAQDAGGMKRGGKPRKYAMGGAAKVRKGVI